MKSDNRHLWWLLAVTPLLLLGCLAFGPSEIGIPDWTTKTGQAVLTLRLNRVFAGFVVGASLSCAGVVFQALLKNPLAEPYILGVSSGAGLGAAVAILTGIGAAGVFVVPACAFVMAVLTLAMVYALASNGAPPAVFNLILSGVIVSAVCSSLLMFLVATAPVEGLHSVIWWMLGNLEVPSASFLVACAALIGCALAMVWLLSPELNALTLGRDIAHHVGVRTERTVRLALALATLITATAVALAGLIGFVGLIVPHAMRAVVGPDHRRLVPASALAGGVFLALCDAVARTALAPIEIPVGVISAMLGGPFFLAILRNRKRRGWIG